MSAKASDAGSSTGKARDATFVNRIDADESEVFSRISSLCQELRDAVECVSPHEIAEMALEQIDQLNQAGFEIWAMTPRMDAEPLYALTPPKKLAILLGAEGPGLPEDLIAAARPVRIPMSAGFDSVNVATAGAIALAHVFAQR